MAIGVIAAFGPNNNGNLDFLPRDAAGGSGERLLSFAGKNEVEQLTNPPAGSPSTTPSVSPSTSPTETPMPSTAPSSTPSEIPSLYPSVAPSRAFSETPSASLVPTQGPSITPTSMPSLEPSFEPTVEPSGSPSSLPSSGPSSQPSAHPTDSPTSSPSSAPSGKPSLRPSLKPSSKPSSQPSLQPSLQPSSEPSSQPSLEPRVMTVFATSAKYTGDLVTEANTQYGYSFGSDDGIAAGDALCQELADKEGLCGTFTAWLSVMTSASPSVYDEVRDRLSANVAGYQRTDGSLIATDTTDLLDGVLSAPITYDEAGSEITSDFTVWTNSYDHGEEGSDNGFSCQKFASSSSSDKAIAGVVSKTESWSRVSTYKCNIQYRLACFQVSPTGTTDCL